MTNSTCDRLVSNSTLENSNITGPKNSLVVDANLTNVKHHGSISGTFSDIEPGDITVHDMKAIVEIPIRSIRSTYHIYPTTSFQLLQDNKGSFALTDLAEGEYQFGNTKFPLGNEPGIHHTYSGHCHHKILQQNWKPRLQPHCPGLFFRCSRYFHRAD